MKCSQTPKYKFIMLDMQEKIVRIFSDCTSKLHENKYKGHQHTKKSRIRETPTLSTNANSRTDTNLKRLRDLSSLFFNCGQKIWGESPPPPTPSPLAPGYESG